MELGECLQTGCLQGSEKEFEHSGEAYSLNSLLVGAEKGLKDAGAEKGLKDAVNPFAELNSAWQKYTAAVSMFLSIQYGIIMILLFAVFLKYGVAEFTRSLLSTVFVDLYGVAERKRITKPRK